MTQKAFKALMATYGATPCAIYGGGYVLALCGHRLWCSYDKGSPKEGGDWVFTRWLTGDPALLAAYKAAPRTSDLWPDNETYASRAAYDAYAASERADAASIKAKGLPHNNPYSLKWNHGGYGGTATALDSFTEGLEMIKARGE